MRVTTERLEDCQVNVIVEMDAVEVDKRLRDTARKISRQFNVPGYRRGRAPFHAVVRVFGREALQQEALEDFGQELYEKALEEIEYEPFQPGELTTVEWDPFRMTVLLPIRPEVDLGDYRAVRVPFGPEETTDEAIEEYLARLQEEHTQWVPIERPAALGDQVVLDAKGTIGDEVVMDHEGYELLLESEARHPLPGFHEQIVGLEPGAEKTFVLTYPEDDSHEGFSGQDVALSVHLFSVKEKDVPALDDDLASMVGDYDTLDDLRASVRERMETEALQKAESEYLDRVLGAMVEAAVKIEYPPQAIDQEAELTLDRMERNLASSGIELDRYLAMMGKTREAYKADIRPSAEARLQKRLVLLNVAEREGIEIEDEQIEAEIDRVSGMMGDQADKMREMLQSPMGRLSVSDDLLMERSQERVVQIGKGQAPPPEPQDAEAVTEVDAQPKGDIPAGAGEESEGELVANNDVQTEARPETEIAEGEQLNGGGID